MTGFAPKFVDNHHFQSSLKVRFLPPNPPTFYDSQDLDVFRKFSFASSTPQKSMENKWKTHYPQLLSLKNVGKTHYPTKFLDRCSSHRSPLLNIFNRKNITSATTQIEDKQGPQ